MKKGDYISSEKRNINGKSETFYLVETCNTHERFYVRAKGAGQGGFAKIHEAVRCSDRKKYAFKEFFGNQDPGTLTLIKRNIRNLLNNPLIETDRTPLKGFIPPKFGIVELPGSQSFGYIMDFIDTKAFINKKTPLFKRDTAPDAKALCRMMKDVTHVFFNIHNVRGYFYKDINTGNIYINTKTGETLIADGDNISPKAEAKTVKGTPDFMAPEIYLGTAPDRYTDLFSLASYFLFVMTGAYPLKGTFTEKYYIDHNTAQGDPASDKYLYGENPAFIFDPDNTKNSIVNSQDPNHQAQTERWNLLPKQFQDAFMTTFTKGLKTKNFRVSVSKWEEIANEVENNHLVRCPQCGKYSFDHNTYCKFCLSTLPRRSIAKPDESKKSTAGHNSVISGQRRNTASMPPLKCMYWLAGVKKGKKSLGEGKVLFSAFDSSLPNREFFSLSFNQSNNTYVFKNLTSAEIHVRFLFFGTNNQAKAISYKGEMKNFIDYACAPQNIMNLLLKNEKSNTSCRFFITVRVQDKTLQILLY